MTLYTPEDLLQYLYKETSEAQHVAIEKALSEDWTLREKFEVLRSCTSRLDRITESPRTEVVLQVLKYAKESITQPA